MIEQRATEPKDEQRLICEGLMREVLKGSPSGMDRDSLIAAEALLLEVETTKAVIHLLQTGELSGCVDDDGTCSYVSVAVATVHLKTIGRGGPNNGRLEQARTTSLRTFRGRAKRPLRRMSHLVTGKQFG